MDRVWGINRYKFLKFFFQRDVLSFFDDRVVVRNSLYFESQSCCVINLHYSSLGEKSKHKQNTLRLVAPS